MVSCVFWAYNAVAADPWNRLMRDQQHALFLGQVQSRGPNSVEYKVVSLITGQTLPDQIVVTDPKAGAFERKLKPADYALVSVDKIQKNYIVKWGTFKVDSNNPATLKVLEGPASEADLQSLQKYINSGGKFKDFPFPGSERVFSKNLDRATQQKAPTTNQ